MKENRSSVVYLKKNYVLNEGGTVPENTWYIHNPHASNKCPDEPQGGFNKYFDALQKLNNISQNHQEQIIYF